MAEPFHVPFVTGECVRVRGGNWRITGITGFEACATLSLQGTDASTVGQARILIYPFDRPIPVRPRATPVVVSRRRGLRAIATCITASPPYTSLHAASGSRVDLHPFQLEPALAISQGLTSRLLLADEVGLGKTIQAGLVLAELQARGDCDRALIVTPAGMRDQWAHELSARFAIAAQVVDLAALAIASSELPAGMNPWSLPGVRIVSIDFLKQTEVARALSTLLWDLLIFDEAHHLASSTERGDAARMLAGRARHVLLLTATPHGGDEREFRSLCSIGRAPGDDDPVLMFRRSRAHVGFADDCRARLLSVRPTVAERRVHALLDRYARDLRRGSASWEASRRSAIQLLISVLHKRAFSSASSLLASVQRRRQLLGSGESPVFGAQPMLPFDDEGQTDDLDPVVLGTAGFEDVRSELDLLESIASAAARATSCESKLRVLRKLLHRTRERMIVFTEYRDTLMRVAAALAPEPLAMLHGGMTRRERRAAEQRFRSGAARLLVATDAAGEGLNLHHGCRLVVSLELPWSPLRLEQRVGRVNRLGQTRRVHALSLLARGTLESRVLARLATKSATARHSLEAEGPLATATGAFRVVDLRRDAEAECRRLLAHRRLAAACARTTPTAAPFIVRARRRSMREHPGIAIYRVGVHDSVRRTLEDVIVPLAVSDWVTGRRIPDRALKALILGALAMAGDRGAQCAASYALRRVARIQPVHERIVDRRASRELALLAALNDARTDTLACLAQRSLFHRNPVEAAADDAEAQLEPVIRAGERRLARLVLDRDVHVQAPQLIAVLPI